jgi:hypothetical protein
MLRKLLLRSIVTFLVVTLSFTQSGYASSSDNSTSSYEAEITWGIAVSASIAAAALIYHLLAVNDESQGGNTPVPPITISGTPVVLSASNYNLLSVARTSAATTSSASTIVVQNNGIQTPKFNITSNDSNSLTTIDPSSTCYQTVVAGGQCTFKINRTTNSNPSAGVSGTPVTFKITGAQDSESDFITLNVINLQASVLFDPTVYDTYASGINGQKAAYSFATTTKNGVTFIYVGTANGVFKTNDGGTTWMAVNNGLVSAGVTHSVGALYFVGNVLYAGTNDGGGVFKTSNGGAAWTQVTTSGLTYLNVNALYAIGTVLYAGTGSGANGDVFSIDTSVSGASWQLVGSSIGKVIYALNSSSDGTLYAGVKGGGVFSLTGGSWSPVGTSIASYDVYALCFIGNVLYAGTSNGVYSIDPATTDWSSIGAPPLTTSIYALYAIGDILYAGDAPANGKVYQIDTSLIGVSWVQIGTPTSATGDVYALYATGTNVNDTTLYAGYSSGGVYKAAANISSSASWTSINHTLSAGTGKILTLLMLGTDLYAGTDGKGVFKSGNGGATWEPVYPEGLTATYASTVNALSSYNNTLYAGTDGAGVYALNNGTTWTAISTGLSSLYVYSLYKHSLSGSSSLYAGTYNTVFGGGMFLFDGSSSWSKVCDPHGTLFYYDTHAISGTQVLYLGTATANLLTSGGVWQFTPGETTCAAMSPSLNQNVYALNSIGTNLYAGTAGYGVYGVDTSATTPTWAQISVGDLGAYTYVEDLYPIGTTLYAAANNSTTPTSGEVFQLLTGVWSPIPLASSGATVITSGIFSLFPSVDNAYLYVGTGGGGGVLKTGA